jgi:hypothetical protein
LDAAVALYPVKLRFIAAPLSSQGFIQPEAGLHSAVIAHLMISMLLKDGIKGFDWFFRAQNFAIFYDVGRYKFYPRMRVIPRSEAAALLSLWNRVHAHYKEELFSIGA